MKPAPVSIPKDDKLHFAVLVGIFAAGLACSLLMGWTVTVASPLLILFGLLAIFRLDFIVYFSVLITPLSINLAQTSLGIGMSLPSEPIMFMLFVLFWLKVFHDGLLDRKILLHPVSVVIIVHLLWFIITTAYSTMPLVSVKYTLARLCYISVFYFMLLVLFRRKGDILRFIWLYTVPLLLVVGYTVFQHALGGFSEEVAHTAMVPFYNDHTAYAAVLSFFIPVMIGLTADRNRSKNQRFITGFVSLVLLSATVLSYTRAAWVGLAAALCCYLIFVMRLKTALVYSGIIMTLLFVILFWTQITMALESNQEVSSDDYGSHIQSIGNISSDDSNVERLNRWACALRMFANEPIHGYGPGTYMFKYGALQKYSERSGISTNFAEGGGSHSEYLGPLSEQGILGPILYLAIIAVTVQTTARFMVKTRSNSDKILARSILLGLVTYWVHGLLNYFLDTEKASVPHWGFIAALVALQLGLNQEIESNQSPSEHPARQ
ncbi:MAG: O-antigen ligase family protein [Bacteroidota bacterium]|jgi:putative inorganic carbon (HCO3(-)) transporter